MPFTLSDLLQRAYQRLGQANVSTATGGSTTTVIDSKQADQHSDDDWNGGTLIVTRDAGGAGAAPEGEFFLIDGYVNSTGTFTIATATSGVASGDRYMYTSELYPLNDMIELANQALASLPEVPQVDRTTLDSAAAQTEYTYALAWKRQPPYRVQYQGRTGDANDTRPEDINGWDYEPAAAGSTGLLHIPQIYVSRDIYIWYRGPHGYVSAFDDTIYEGFNPELVTAVLVERALEWQNSRTQGGDDFLIQRWNDAKAERSAAEQKYLVWRPKKRPKLLVTRRRLTDQFQINP